MQQARRILMILGVFLVTSAVTVAVFYLLVAPAQDLRTSDDWRGFRTLAGGAALVLSFIVTGVFVTKWENRRIDSGQADDDLRRDIERDLERHQRRWLDNG